MEAQINKVKTIIEAWKEIKIIDLSINRKTKNIIWLERGTSSEIKKVSFNDFINCLDIANEETESIYKFLFNLH